jgi:ABC-type taurine transport system ATPase subunit
MSEPVASFDALLREKMAELDADEASHLLITDDPVERLRLDARQVVLADAPMPRPGHQAYRHPPVSPSAEASPRRLDLRT